MLIWGGIYTYNNGDLEIYFNIISEGTVDKLGTKTSIKTYSYNDYPDMIRNNAQSNNFDVIYSDIVSGHLYRAKIYFYAEKGGYDTRDYITASVIAP